MEQSKKVTQQDLDKFITDDAEYREILKDILNGDYTAEALKQDYTEWRENNE